MKFWAKRGRKLIGPHSTREEALEAFRSAYPAKGPEWKANAKSNDILTGYGETGPGFDMRWDKAAPVATLRPVQMEVGTGKPGYRWIDAYEVQTPEGGRLAPYMRKAEARAFCGQQGWTFRIAAEARADV